MTDARERPDAFRDAVLALMPTTPEDEEPKGPYRAKRGRPPLLDDRKREIFLTAIRAGNRIQIAARFARIAPSTVEEWMRRGRGEDDHVPPRPPTPFFVKLVEDVENAQADAEAHAMLMIRQGMSADPKWAAWYLENKHREWRARNDPPPPPPPPPQLPPQSAVGHADNVIVIPASDLRAFAAKRLAATLPPEPDDDARAGLVIEHE